MTTKSTKNVIGKLQEKIYLNYYDELFDIIDKNSFLSKTLNKFKISLQYIVLFSWFFIILALIAFIFYPKKYALILFGFVSIIHTIFAPLALLGIKKQNRYFIFSFCLANLIWLSIITFTFYYLSFFADSKNIRKITFKKEIIVHVGFAFYYPISVFACYYCLMIFKDLVNLARKENLES